MNEREMRAAIPPSTHSLDAELAPTVTCLACGFRYGAEHEDVRGGYVCPLCELAARDSATMGATMTRGFRVITSHLVSLVATVRAWVARASSSTHNAGVAGSSPAPATMQPVDPYRVSGLSSFPAGKCATTSATKAPVNGWREAPAPALSPTLWTLAAAGAMGGAKL